MVSQVFQALLSNFAWIQIDVELSFFPFNSLLLILFPWLVTLLLVSLVHIVRHGKMDGSGRVQVWSIGLQVKWVVGWVSLRVGSSWPVFFKQIYIYIYIFFFFEVDDICQLFMSSLTVIRFSLMILLPITTKHLTWYPNLV